MLALTHLIVSLLLIQLLTLDRNDAFVGLLFGVFIDVDHLIGLKDYTQTNGYAAVFDLDSITNPGGHWKSLFHSPVAVAVVGPLSVASRFAIPLVFWGIHVAMDFVEETFLGNFSGVEAMLFAMVGIAFVSLRYAKYLESYARGTLGQYFRVEMEGIKRLFSPAIKSGLAEFKVGDILHHMVRERFRPVPSTKIIREMS